MPADSELVTGFDTAAALWDPVLAGATDGTVWNPVGAMWQPSANRPRNEKTPPAAGLP